MHSLREAEIRGVTVGWQRGMTITHSYDWFIVVLQARRSLVNQLGIAVSAIKSTCVAISTTELRDGPPEFASTIAIGMATANCSGAEYAPEAPAGYCAVTVRVVRVQLICLVVVVGVSELARLV